MLYKILFCDKPYPTYEYQRSKISERQNVYDICIQFMYVNLWAHCLCIDRHPMDRHPKDRHPIDSTL